MPNLMHNSFVVSKIQLLTVSQLTPMHMQMETHARKLDREKRTSQAAEGGGEDQETGGMLVSFH